MNIPSYRVRIVSYAFVTVLLLARLFAGGCSSGTSGTGAALKEQNLVAVSTRLPPPKVPITTLPHQAQPIERHWANKYEFQDRSLSTTIAEAELEAEYPRATNTRNTRLLRFNRWIRTRVLDHVARFKRAARINNRKGHLIEMGLDLGYYVFYSDDNLISMRLTHRLMEAGQMHPINYYETLNYDLNRGRILRANEVFKQGYLKVFSNYSRKWLTEHYTIENSQGLKGGTAPKTNNFKNWNIVPDGIFISFEDYQVGSHSFGQPELVVPYVVLQRTVKRGTPMAKLLVLGANRKKDQLPQARKQR